VAKLISILRSTYRGTLLVILLIAACIHGQYRKTFRGMKVGPEGAVWVSAWCRRIVAALGIRCTVEGTLPEAGPRGLAVVSNHLSYLDILIYSSIRPFIMVAKYEIKSWPLLGFITAQAGTIYVQRRDYKGGQTQTRAQVNAMMATAFRSGLPVLFFPEGTTTDGCELLPFRRGLYNSVVYDSVPMKVAAMVFSFDEPNPGKTIGEHVCFVGDAEFAPHMFEALGLRGVHANVRFGQAEVEGTDRFELSVNSRDRMQELIAEIHQTIALAGGETSPLRDRVLA
jgi:1-acyl-sn-glycerol-3-phosphate acyltransferase